MTETVAVAGGFGFLGTNITKVLERKSYDVIPFSRKSGVDIRRLDVVSGLIKEKKPDIVINSAAHVGGIAYNAIRPTEIFEDNLMIGFNLLKAASEGGVKKFVNIMPNCTYPGVAEIYREDEWWDGPMHETVLTYGMPRKTLWVQAWAMKKKNGFNSIHLVLPNLYGPNDHFDPTRSHALGALVRKIVDAKLLGRDTVEIWGTGAPVREWGFVEDAAEGIVRGMEKYNDIEIMNIGEGSGYTIAEIAHIIKEVVGWQGEFVFDTSKPDGALRKVLDVTKMRSVLGWQPSTSLRNGVKRTVEWYLQNRQAVG